MDADYSYKIGEPILFWPPPFRPEDLRAEDPHNAIVIALDPDSRDVGILLESPLTIFGSPSSTEMVVPCLAIRPREHGAAEAT